MTKIILYFIKIGLRKLLSKDDVFGMLLLIFVYLSFVTLVYFNYETTIKLYIVSFFLVPTTYHINRNDFDLLKIKKNYKVLIFIEYFIYCLPFYVVLILKKEFLLTASILMFYALFIATPKLNFKIVKYPFQLFNPFWHICFRKYKLVLALPIAIGLIMISENYKNENLIYFSFLILISIACYPSFERENLEEIKINPFDAKKYLFCQFKNSIINTSYLLIPILITLLVLLNFQMILFLPILLLFPLINILMKYVYFFNILTHQLAFIVFMILSFTLFGLPFLTIPFLHKKAINNLNSIKHANH